MTQDASPTAGARFELRWLDLTDEAVRYQAAVHQPGRRHDYLLTITLQDGVCGLAEAGAEPVGAPAPEPWVRAYLQALSRQLYREARREGSGPWPRRIMRWRNKSEG